MLAERADHKSHAAMKKLTLADTTLFAERKEPRANVEQGDEIKKIIGHAVHLSLRRSMPAEASRLILSFSDHLCSAHEEQCTLAEFCSHLARDVMAHIDLAAEARTKPRAQNVKADDVDEDADSTSDNEQRKQVKDFDIADMGGGGPDDIVDDGEDVPTSEISSFPCRSPEQAIRCVLQADTIANSRSKKRRNDIDRQIGTI